MKNCIASCTQESILHKVALDFRAMKKIAEDANRGGWYHYLPDEFNIIQEVETRFGKLYLDAEPFLKASSKVLIVLQTKNRPIATTAFGGMKKKADVDAGITGFSATETNRDALSIVMECLGRFEVLSRPAMIVAFPTLFAAIKDLGSFAGGKIVWGKSSLHMVQPSI